MSEKHIRNYVWHNAGLSYAEDGIYIEDFGVCKKIATYDETWWDNQQEATQ